MGKLPGRKPYNTGKAKAKYLKILLDLLINSKLACEILQIEDLITQLLLKYMTNYRKLLQLREEKKKDIWSDSTRWMP